MKSSTLFVDNLIGTILEQYNFLENNFHELVIFYIKNNFHELVIFYTRITCARATCLIAKCVTNTFKHKPTSISLYV